MPHLLLLLQKQYEKRKKKEFAKKKMRKYSYLRGLMLSLCGRAFALITDKCVKTK